MLTSEMEIKKVKMQLNNYNYVKKLETLSPLEREFLIKKYPPQKKYKTLWAQTPQRMKEINANKQNCVRVFEDINNTLNQSYTNTFNKLIFKVKAFVKTNKINEYKLKIFPLIQYLEAQVSWIPVPSDKKLIQLHKSMLTKREQEKKNKKELKASVKNKQQVQLQLSKETAIDMIKSLKQQFNITGI